MAVANKRGNGRCDCDALNEQINELAAQVENCNQRERDECEKKNEQAAVKISSLQRKLTVYARCAAVKHLLVNHMQLETSSYHKEWLSAV